MNSNQSAPAKAFLLIVDDILSSLQILSTFLIEQGYDIRCASNGSLALAIVEETSPDLILLDVNMPEMDGYEVCRRLKANPQSKEIPIIFISGIDETLNKVKAFRVGGIDYITKPFQTEELLIRIENHLTIRKLQKELQQANDVLEERVAERTEALSETVAALEEQIAEREQAETALQHYAERLLLLHRLDQALLTAQSLEAITQVALQHIQLLIPCQRASLVLFNFEANEAVVFMLDTQGETELGSGKRISLDVFGDTADLLAGQPHVVEDLAVESELSGVDKQRLAEGIRSLMNIPLVVRDELIGSLNLGAMKPSVFSAEHIAIAREVATQLAVTISQVRLLEAEAKRRQEAETLRDIAAVLNSSLNLEEVLEQVMAEVQRLLEAESASVLLYDPTSDDLGFAAASTANPEILIGKRLPTTAGIAGWVMQNRQAIVVDNAQHDPRFDHRIDTLMKQTTRSLLAVPLIFKDTIIGVIEVVNRVKGGFDQYDLEMLQVLAASAAMAIENANLYKDLQGRIQALQDTQAQLIHSEKMAALGRLVASIAHEINNPLQSVQTCLTLTREELDSNQNREKLDRYLGIVESEIDRISTIVRRMRDFYRPARPGLYPVDLHEILESVLELVGKQLQHSNIGLERDLAPVLPKIQANPDHLKQVFLNIILNAIDAMPQGGVLRISTILDEIQPDNNTLSRPAVRLTLSDTGDGMSNETKAHLFEPFFTTKPGGSGLGLTISYGIIEAHHGQITITSQEGQGTIFTLRLPLKQP